MPPVTLTVSDAQPFVVGQTIQVGGWPNWTRFFPTFREWARWLLAKFGKKIGPQRFRITRCDYAQNQLIVGKL